MAELLGRDPASTNCKFHWLSIRLFIVLTLHLSDVFTEEEKEKFKDPEYYKEFRHALEDDLNVSVLGSTSHTPTYDLLCGGWQGVHLGTLKDTAMQKGAREAFKASMLQRLAKKPWIADHSEQNIQFCKKRSVTHNFSQSFPTSVSPVGG